MPTSSLRTAVELAELVAGELSGDPQRGVAGPAALASAQSQHVSFLGNPRYLDQAKASQAGVLLLDPTTPAPRTDVTLIRVANPSAAFARICAVFAPEAPAFPPGIAPGATVAHTATVDPSASVQPGAVVEDGARIGKGTVIGANVYVGHHAVIGDGCHLYPNVVVRERCVLGDRVILQPGVVIGSDGFGFDITSPTNEKIPQIGIVRIGNDVEIGSNSCVDRARFGETVIGNGVKVDNLVQIAHNCVVGDNSVICALTGVAGSTTLGRRVILAGQVGLAGHTSVGDGAILTAKSGVSKDVPPGMVVSGVHALPMKEELKLQAALRQVPDLIKRIRALERERQAGA